MVTKMASETAGKVLHMSFELGLEKWKLGFTTGLDVPVRIREIPGRDLERLKREIAEALNAFGLIAGTRIVSCYEAGRDGNWLHRWLGKQGIENHVVDSASIEVSRRKRKAKTDRLDATKLALMLVRYVMGEKKVWSVVRVPNEADEDARHLHRGLSTAQEERTRLRNRIKGIVFGHGVRVVVIGKDFDKRLGAVKTWDGNVLPPGVIARVMLEWERLQVVETQILALKRRQREQVREAEKARAASRKEAKKARKREKEEVKAIDKVVQLRSLRGIGTTGAWILVHELFGWRTFSNRREVGGLMGFAPTPYDSGEDVREQGISKAGNRLVKKLAVELAWSWLRHQPGSALSRWYQRRFANAGKRMRKIGIVAVGRRLVIALWRYVEFDEVPRDALLKQEAA